VAFAVLAWANTNEPTSTAATNTPAKPKIGVMKFDVSKNLDPALSGLLYDALTEQAVKSKQFTVVDWEQIDRVLQYVAKSQPNLSPEDARRQAVNQLGIQQLFLGSAAKLGSKFFLSVKVLNLDLSVDKVEKESVDNEEQLVDAVASIAARLLGLPPPPIKPAAQKKDLTIGENTQASFPFRGRVTAIDYVSATLTVGERSFQVTAKTLIDRGDKLATLRDGVVGEEVTGWYWKTDEGELHVRV
jgi:hypothetical protein